jgi:hypothetical protein
MPTGSLVTSAPLRIGAHSLDMTRYRGITGALDELEIIRGVVPAGLPLQYLTKRKCR